MIVSKLARAIAGLTLAAAPFTVQAQDDKLSIHGSASLAYGKSDNLPIFGVSKDGTSNYRVLALQFGYTISDKDRVVTQLLHRRFGDSPLNAVTPDIEPIWAFYERKFDNGVTMKAGRNPLPRGIFNEVRFIGTLLPLFRVGNAVYGETLEFLDGVTVRKPFALGSDWTLDVTAFGGGYDIKAQLPTSTGVVTVNQRNENSYGGQVWLKTPIDGVQFGAFLNNYQTTPSASLPAAARPKRVTTLMYSADAVFTKGFVRGELTTFDQAEQPNFLDFTSYYAQAGLTPTEQLTFVAEYGAGTNVVRFAGTPLPDLDLPLNKEFTVGVMYKPSAQVAFKLEGRRVEGYSFDQPVPSIIPPTAPPLVARLAPASKTFFALASVAFTF
jgi:hypothetical protein